MCCDVIERSKSRCRVHVDCESVAVVVVEVVDGLLVDVLEADDVIIVDSFFFDD